MIFAVQAPEGASVKDWDLHHGPKPVGAPYLFELEYMDPT